MSVKIIYETGQVYFGSPLTTLVKESRLIQFFEENGAFPTDDALFGASAAVTLGRKILIGANVTMYEGTQIGDGVIVEDNIRLGYDCVVGADTRIMYGAYICDRVQIGSNSRIAGFIGDACRIGSNCTVMGDLVHRYTVADLEWGAVDEPSPVVEDGAIVGFGAKIVGGVRIGHNAFVGAGAVVTKDVPPATIVVGINEHLSPEAWRGRELSEFFARRMASDAPR